MIDRRGGGGDWHRSLQPSPERRHRDRPGDAERAARDLPGGRREAQRLGDSIVPRHCFEPQWQAQIFFSFAVCGSSRTMP